MSIWKNALTWMAAGISYLWIRLLSMTCTIVVEQGKEHLEDLIANPRPAIFSFWHNTIFFMVYYHAYRVIKKGIPLSVLISQSKDGELIARTAQLYGSRAARGSSTRGGREAFQILLKTVKKEKGSVVTTPDGPQGPVYYFQAGTVVLSQVTGAPVVPIGYACTRAWVFRSWDQFIVPKPFSKIAVGIGEPYTVPRKLPDDAAAERERQELERRMMAMIHKAENFLEEKYGRVDSRTDLQQAAEYQRRKAEREAKKHGRSERA
ncbi:MAG: lysophospholipid acyltransferase family protein [bacterium]|nr:lysophospholipid acyltransferase family protein [bacterium]